MKQLANTLFVTTPDAYLALDGENVVILKKDTELRRVPLHNLEGIIAFGYTGASPALMGACAKRKIALSFLSQKGNFLARSVGEEQGNVLLRKTQYRLSDSEAASADLARSFLLAKVHNSRWILERAARDYALRLDVEKLKQTSAFLADSIGRLESTPTLEEMRGVEGEAAAQYFSVFDDLILQQKEDFRFTGRNRRPPLDKVNAMLSFVYTLLAHDAASALEAVGLDAYVGFLHRDRPGRASLALDLMAELRGVMADRLVLTLINRRMLRPVVFYKK